jgi:UDP-N-acetylmuramyl pentapeptide phosphotransferase/UDP-N-acetylglucosamine-1-phosphate transferase
MREATALRAIPWAGYNRAMDWRAMLLGSAAVFLISLGGTGVALKALRRHAVLDHPNERSSHATPTPKGGGIAVVSVLLLAWAASAPFLGAGLSNLPLLLVLAAGLAAISFVDDLKGIPPLVRLVVHFAAAAAGLLALPGAGSVFQGLLPPPLDMALSLVLWVWFINLFNFMDGIDGLAGVETAAIGLGLAALALLTPWADGLAFLGLSLAAAAIGFLYWNRPPARIFLGDVGSVPLGFLLGWLLAAAAAAGYWKAALILPLYYLADASITLAWRGLRGKRVWLAHRDHFYQRAVRAGRSHGEVVRLILFADLALVFLALLAETQEQTSALLTAAITVTILLYILGRRRPEKPPEKTEDGPQGPA